MEILRPRPLTRETFEAFGAVIETHGAESFAINKGTTERFHALAQSDVGQGETILSVFRGQPFEPPVSIGMMERHPLGTQAFMPLQNRPWLIVVAPDKDGKPGQPQAFLAQGSQGVQYARNVWHHPLISLEVVSDFLVVDRLGDGNNLEEVDYLMAYSLTL